MALDKDQLPHGSCISSKLQAWALSEEEDSSESSNGVIKTSGAMTVSSCLSGPGSADGKGYISKGCNLQPEETESLFNFKAGCYDSVMHNSEFLFSFQQSSLVINDSNYMMMNNQKENHCVWGNGMSSCYQWSQVSPKYISEPRLQQDFSCFQTASSYCSDGYKAKEDQPDQWLHSESTIVADTPHELQAHEPALHKRPSTEDSMQAQKKHCSSNASKKQKSKSTPSKDPQSIAAKNRRERISERLKILQELVPNGSKVDLVTMLEKAISYVKFLQLQVKVLATDEFWPAQGGKAPDISQVKEAIDAVLASRKDRNSNLKVK